MGDVGRRCIHLKFAACILARKAIVVTARQRKKCICGFTTVAYIFAEALRFL